MWDLRCWMLDVRCWMFSSFFVPPVSSQDVGEHCPVNVGETAFDAVVVVGEAFVIQAQQMEDRGVEIVKGCHVLHRLVAKLVGGPVTEPLLYTRARQPDCESVRIVVASVGAF